MKKLAMVFGVWIVGSMLLAVSFNGWAEEPRTTIQGPEIKIEGKVLRPSVQVTMQRSKANYEALRPETSFLDRIIRSADREIR